MITKILLVLATIAVCYVVHRALPTAKRLVAAAENRVKTDVGALENRVVALEEDVKKLAGKV